MKLVKIALAVITLSVTAQNVVAQAQKIGHLNTGNLLEQMPEVALADSTLRLEQKRLLAVGDSLAQVFEKEYKVYEDASKAGTLSGIESQKRQQMLAGMQQELQTYEELMNQKLQQTRGQLLAPILTKVDAAIQAIGKEGGYAYIIDVSKGDALYVDEAEDIMPKVKAKLGLK